MGKRNLNRIIVIGRGQLSGSMPVIEVTAKVEPVERGLVLVATGSRWSLDRAAGGEGGFLEGRLDGMSLKIMSGKKCTG
jgi:hypothetical protein